MAIPFQDTFAAGLLALEWAIRIVMLIIVPFRRSAEASRSWLLLLLFLPIPGLLLYLLIGRPGYPLWRRAKYRSARALLARAGRQIAHLESCRPPALGPSFVQAARLIEAIGHFPPLAGNRCDLLSDYDGALRRMIEDIDLARDHVHLLTYIFADDAAGEAMIESLARAARRGVECRVLLDALGSKRWSSRILARLQADGIAARNALPPGNPLSRWVRPDLRNHRKLLVVDGRTGYVGSQNVVSARRGRLVNEELTVRANGPVVVELQAVFAADWFLEANEVLAGDRFFPHVPPGGDAVAQLVPSGPDHAFAGLGELVVALVHGARESVVVTTPYFIPDEALVQALRSAVRRGVAVELVVPERSDHLLVHLAQRSYYAELLESGVRVHRYRPGFLHAKHISIDSEVVLVGSGNFDMRSFILNEEAMLVIYGADAARRLAVEQQRYFEQSLLLTAQTWQARPGPVKVAENLARLFSPLL